MTQMSYKMELTMIKVHLTVTRRDSLSLEIDQKRKIDNLVKLREENRMDWKLHLVKEMKIKKEGYLKLRINQMKLKSYHLDQTH
jgi:hypothetical protein